MLFSLAAVSINVRACDFASESSRGSRGKQPSPTSAHLHISPLPRCYIIYAHSRHLFYKIWESFTRVLDGIPRVPPSPPETRTVPSPSNRTQQQRAMVGEGVGVGTFSNEFVDPATPRGARLGAGLSGGLDARGTSPIAGSGSGMIGMQPAYMLLQKGSESEGKEETLDLSRRGLRSGVNNGVGIAFTKAIREFRYENGGRFITLRFESRSIQLFCRLDNVVVLNISRNKLTLLEVLPPQLQVLNVSKVCVVGKFIAAPHVTANFPSILGRVTCCS
jgi:hypothetical protein